MPLPPPPAGRLQQNRVADLDRSSLGFGGVGHGVRQARYDRDAGLCHASTSLRLVAHRCDRVRPGANKDQPSHLDRGGEVRALGEEAVPGVDRLRIDPLGEFDQGIATQIALGRRRRTNAVRLIRLQYVGRKPIRLRVYGDRADATFAGSAGDANGNFATVRDQDR